MNSAWNRYLLLALILAAVPALLRAEQGLVANYKFEEGTGSLANDSSGNGNTGTLTNGPVWSTGFENGGVSFDGSNDFIRVPRSESTEHSGGVTVAMWANITNSRSGSIADLVRKKAQNGGGWILRWSNSDGKAHWYIQSTNASAIFDVTDPTPNSSYVGNWHHFAGTFDSATGQSCLYVDGVLKAADTGAAVPITYSDDLYMMYANAQTATPGTLDEMRIFDRALSEAEIQSLIPELPPVAAADHYQVQPGSVLNVSAPGVLSNDVDINDETLTAVLNAGASNGSVALNPNGSFSYTPQNGFTGLDTFTYHANDGHGNDSPVATVTINVTNNPPGLIAWYKFNEGAGTLANDSSGNGNTGALANGPVWSTGVENGAVNFDGSNDEVVVPRSASTEHPGGVTLALWANITNSRSGNIADVMRKKGSNGGWILRWSNSDGKVRWYIQSTSASSIFNIADPTPNSTYVGTWHHFAGTFDSATGQSCLYVDGVLKASGSGAAQPIIYTDDLYMMYANSQTATPGTLDDVRIFDRALSEVEIQNVLSQPPAAKADYYFTQPGGVLTVPAPGVLSNDSDINADTLTAVLNTTVTSGSLNLSADGSFTYTPQNGFTGTDTFTYHANDGHGNDSAVVTVTITVANVPPGLIAWYKFDEGAGATSADSTGNGIDATLVSGAGWSSGIINGAIHTDGTSYATLSNSAMLNFAANAPFTISGWVKATELSGPIIALRSTTSVNPVIDLTIGYTGTSYPGRLAGVVRHDGTGGTALEVVGGTIADGTWHMASLTRDSGGTVSLYLDAVLQQSKTSANAAGAITTDARALGSERRWVQQGFGAPDDRFLVGDLDDFYIFNRQLSESELRALMPQLAPSAQNDLYAIAPGNVLNVAAPGVLTNDIDLNQDTLTAVKNSDPAHGVLALNSDGSFIYTPENGFSGIDTFIYHANDGHGNDSPVATATIIVANIPSGVIAWYKFDEGAGTLAHDSTGNGIDTTLVSGASWFSGIVNGAMHTDGAGYATLSNSPLLNFAANAPFTISGWVKATELSGPIIALRSTTSVNPVIDLTIGYTGSSYPGRLTGVVRHDGTGGIALEVVGGTVADGTWHMVSLTRDTGGTVSLYLDAVLQQSKTSANAAGAITTNARSFGSERRWVQDGFGAAGDRFLIGDFDDFYIFNRQLSAAELQSLIPQRAPLAQNDSYQVVPGNVLNISAAGVLTNDTDFNGDTLTAVKDSDPAHGLLALNSNGSFTYTPEVGFAGTDNFTYHANDGHGNNSAAAAVTITVADIPAGLVVWYKMDEGTGLTVSDSSGSGNTGTLSAQAWLPGIQGSGLRFDGGNNFLNDSAFNWISGGPVTVSFWNFVSTGQVGNSSAFGLNASGTNRFQAHVPYGDKKLYWDYGDLNGNGRVSLDYAPYLDKWVHVTLVSEGVGGSFRAVYLNGQLAASFSSSDGPKTSISTLHIGHSAEYAVGTNQHRGTFDDFRIYNRVLSSTEILASAQLPPSTFEDSYSVAPGKTLTAGAPGVLSNDILLNAGTMTAQLATGVAHGTLNLSSDGSFTYSPANGFTGTDSFSYRAGDAYGNESSSTIVTISVANASITSLTPNFGTIGTIVRNIQLNGSGLQADPALSLFQGHRYQFLDTAKNWAQAKADCESRGGHVATISSAQEDQFVFALGRLQPQVIGLTDEATEGTFVWITGEPITYTNWFPSQPDNFNGEDAVEYLGGTGGTWNDLSSSTLRKYVCEFESTSGPVVKLKLGNTVLTATNVVRLAATQLRFDVDLAGASAGFWDVEVTNPDTSTATLAGGFEVRLNPTTTTAQNASVDYSFQDQNVTLSAQVAAAARTVNEGVVTFQVKAGVQNLGQAVSSAAITAGTASVSYSIPGGTAPGSYTIQAAYSGGPGFSPSNDNSKTLTIRKGNPVITWSNPANIGYGAALDNTQLNASAGGIPGNFVYSPLSGTILSAGNAQQLSVTFTPNDTVNYNSAQKTVSINVNKAVLTATADNQSKLFGAPNPVLTASYGGFVNGETAAALIGAPALATSATTSSPPGNYPITITQGTLSAANYSFTFINGTLTVSNTPAFFNLSAPTVEYGTASTNLSGKISFGVTGAVAITLNGVSKSATIDASGVFSTDFGTTGLEPGVYPIQYFYPGGGAVDSATDTKTLTIIKAKPAITWANPADIPYGTQLSSTQLNAISNVAGTFAYTPSAGTVLVKGTHPLSTNFTPTDSAHYVSASASVTLVVGLAQAVITWATPADISYGTALSEAQLNATADIAGTFTYSPPSATILDAGDAQKLSLVFTPDDIVNYATSYVDVFINVLKADQSIAFPQIADQEIGNPALTLSATASSNLPVTISLVSGNATLLGNVLSFNGLGAITLRAEQGGDANFNAAPTLEQTFHVIIIPPHVTSALSAGGTQNQAFTFTLTASGTKPVTFESGSLPAGLSLNANTGEISGTPTASGAFQVAATARNGGGTETKTLTLIFASSGGGENHAPKFTSGALATPNPATVNLEVALTTSASDEDGDSVAIVWDFGDGTQGFGSTATHKYTSAGIFAARVTITDGVASDYLNLTVVVNGSVIPPDQFKQYVVAKLGLKFNFAKPNTDSLSISGTIPIPAAFSPADKVIKFESAELQREWTLDKKATSADKAFKLTGKFAKDGTFSASPAKFALALKNQDLFTGLAMLGFINDNTPKGMIVSMPVILVIEGTGYLATVDVKYAAKKGKSGSGKK